MSAQVPQPAPTTLKQAFDLTGRVAVITGGAGLLGVKHGETVAELGGMPVLIDLVAERAEEKAAAISGRYRVRALGLACDITSEAAVGRLRERLLKEFGRIDILINNAANNPAVDDGGPASGAGFARLETMPLAAWNADIAVGLTGAFLCSRTLGPVMAERGGGVILNIASDLGIIAPDQRLYRIDGAPEAEQPVKPVSYSVVKTGLIGLTRYLATYWPGRVRANALVPGGVHTRQPDAFLERLNALIPMSRMAHVDEYKGAVAFLVSDASSYMTGAALTVDGGRTAW